MEHTNLFIGGVDADTSDTWLSDKVLRTLTNMRLQSTDANSGTLINLRGNELEFFLSDGFLPLGYCVQNGVSFIYSVNPVTGEGEIGTFPSPKIAGTGGFDRVYRPLQNWNGAVDPSDPANIFRLPLRTDLFNFDCEHQVEVQPREGWDGSVDLFWADFKNPLRRINTGFDVRTGVYSQRMYWEGSVPQSLNVFWEVCAHPVPVAVSVGVGGALESGNYFIYAAYVQQDLSQSSYLMECGPVQVARDPVSLGPLADGDIEGADTGRNISITIDGVDTSFPYLRIAVVNYSGDTFFTGVVTTLYPVTGTTMTITVTGLEELADIPLADIVKRKAFDDTPKSITQKDNIIFGANWKASELPIEEMRELAHLIKATPNAAANMPELPMPNDTDSGFLSAASTYHDPENTLNRVGYFRGESYSYAIVFVFDDGKESLPYPVTGQDAWFGTPDNPNGILRFPPNTAPGYSFFQNGMARPLGVTFDHNGIPLPAWAIDRLCGFYFMRAERKPNQIYQGVVSGAYRGIDIDTTGLGIDSTDFMGETDICEFAMHDILGIDPGSNGSLMVPYTLHTIPFLGQPYDTNYTLWGPPRAGRFGLFSSDHFFKEALSDGVYTVYQWGRTRMTPFQIGGYERASWFWVNSAFFPDAQPSTGKVYLTNIAPRNYGVSNGFTSLLNRGDDSSLGGPMFFYYTAQQPAREWGNRRMSQRGYIGMAVNDPQNSPIPGTDIGTLTLSDRYNPLWPDNSRAYVSIYREDPATQDYGSLYDPAFVVYYRISNFIPVSDWAGIPAMVFYDGDCFISRMTTRQMNEGNDHEPFEQANLYYAYGNVASYVQECAINNAMRMESGGSRYWPKSNPSNIIAFAAETLDVGESTLLNNGYNRTLGAYSSLGDDPFVLTRTARYITRVRHSHRWVPSDAQDGWMEWDLSARVDYDLPYGQINKIITQEDVTAIVQDRAVQILQINREQLLEGGEANEGQLVIGAGAVLPEKALLRTNEFGSQHQWSVGMTAQAIYGFDLQKRKVWRLNRGQMDILSDRKSFVKDAHAIGELAGTYSDILDEWGDSPVCHSGITFYWDRKNKEIGWTFMLHEESAIWPWQGVRKTLAYNEEMDVYMQWRTHHSPFYMTLNEDLYGIDPRTLPQTVSSGYASNFYLFDKDTVPRLQFFNDQHLAVAGWVAAPSPKDIKVYDWSWLRATDIAPVRVIVDTEYQRYIQDPFLDVVNFERTPVYNENRWKFPIWRAEVVFGNGGQEYAVGSEMRGNWMRMEVTWDTPEPITFALAQTGVRPSLQ